MNFRIAAVLAAVVLGLAGCTADQIPIEYAPSSTLSATGAVKVGNFLYLPSTQGKMKPNQIRNTAVGNIYLDKNVDVFFHNAVFTELRFVGVKVDTGDKSLTGEIREFLIDDLGYSIDWTIDVDYKVTDASGTVIYESLKSTKNRTAKFANPLGTLTQQMKLNIESLIGDPDFIKAIN